MPFYREEHGHPGTPCFWNKSELHRLDSFLSALFSELSAQSEQNGYSHKIWVMTCNCRALSVFLRALARGTNDDANFND